MVLVFGVILFKQTKTGFPFSGGDLSSSVVLLQSRFENREEMVFEGRVEKLDIIDEGWAVILKIGKGTRIRIRLLSKERPLWGQKILVSGKTYLFSEATNPGQFDMKKYYEHLGICGGLKTESFDALSSDHDRLKEELFKLRLSSRNLVEEHTDPSDFPIFESILIGYKKDLDTELKQDYSDFGLLFLISFSGIHISTLGNALYKLLRRSIGKKTAFIFGSVFIIFFYCFTGESASVLRAGIIFLLRIGAPLIKRKADYVTSFSLAVILMVLDEPGIVFLSSFHFAISALFSAGFLMPALRDFSSSKSKRINELFFILSFQVVFLPVRLYWYYQISLVSLFTGPLSFVLLPLILVSVLLGTLFSRFLPALSSLGFGSAHYLVRALNEVVRILKKLPGMNVLNGQPDKIRLILYVVLLTVFYLFLRIRILKRRYMKEEEEDDSPEKSGRNLSLILFGIYVFGILFLKAPAVHHDQVRLTALDIGQGDCTVIETKGRVYISDCGSSSNERGGQDILMPFLKYRGIKKVDMLFLSHGDDDHVSFTKDLLKEIPVGVIFLPDHKNARQEFSEVMKMAEEASVPVRFLSRDLKLKDKNNEVTVLWPEKDAYEEGNDGSLVLYLTCPAMEGIFTGDISEFTEERIKWPSDVDYLKVAHHGSNYSSGESFLKTVNAKVSSVSAGRNNSYGHPGSEAVKRIKDAGTALFSTKDSGAVTFIFKPGSIRVKTFLTKSQEPVAEETGK